MLTTYVRFVVWFLVLVIGSFSVLGIVQQKVRLFEKGKRPLQGVYATLPDQRQEHPLSAKQCVRCHRKIYEQWQQSRHARSYTNRIFSVAFQHSPYRWCVHCHAPLPEQFVQVEPLTRDRQYRETSVGKKQKGFSVQQRALLAEGINCAVCHVRQGRIVTGNKPTPEAKKHHPNIHWDPRWKGGEYCAGCHEFSFTKKLTEPTHVTGVLAQDTYQQWLHSFAKKKGKTCQSCHMHKGGHRFPGGHDVEFVRKALQIRVQWQGKHVLHVELTAKRVGHTIPTGDPFRRLRLDICVDQGCQKILVSRTIHKIFVMNKQGWSVGQDLRVPTPAKNATGRLSFSLALPKQIRKIYWQLTYFYVEFPHHSYLNPQDISQRLYAGMLD